MLECGLPSRARQVCKLLSSIELLLDQVLVLAAISRPLGVVCALNLLARRHHVRRVGPHHRAGILSMIAALNVNLGDDVHALVYWLGAMHVVVGCCVLRLRCMAAMAPVAEFGRILGLTVALVLQGGLR